MASLLSRLYDFVTDRINLVKVSADEVDAEFDQVIAACNQKVLCSTSAPGSPIAGQTWVDTTNKVLKIYLNNEWVTHGPVHIGTSAPATPFEGMLWYDTTNNLLKSYNGSAWAIPIPYPASTAQGDLLYLSAADTIARLAKSATASSVLANSGTDNNPAWATILSLLGAYDTGWVAQADATYTHSKGTLAVLTLVFAATDDAGANATLIAHHGNNDTGMVARLTDTNNVAIKYKSNIGYIWNGSGWVNNWTHQRIIVIQLK